MHFLIDNCCLMCCLIQHCDRTWTVKKSPCSVYSSGSSLLPRLSLWVITKWQQRASAIKFLKIAGDTVLYHINTHLKNCHAQNHLHFWQNLAYAKPRGVKEETVWEATEINRNMKSWNGSIEKKQPVKALHFLSHNHQKPHQHLAF